MVKVKTKATINRHLRELRKETAISNDAIFLRVAYIIETAVRWATQPVEGWPGLVEEAKAETKILKEEVRR